MEIKWGLPKYTGFLQFEKSRKPYNGVIVGFEWGTTMMEWLQILLTGRSWLVHRVSVVHLCISVCKLPHTKKG